MAGQASVFVNQKGAVVWLMGLTIVFQIMAHFRMWSALDAEERGASGRPLDEWCSASLGSGSPRCLEVELFRSWQQPALSRHALGSPLESKVEDMAARSPNATVMGTVVQGSLPLGSPVQAIFGLTTHPTTSSAPRQAAGTAEVWSPLTSWAKGLEKLQKSLEDRFNALPSERHRQAQQRAAEFDRLAEGVSASLERRPETTRWGADLEALQRRLEEKQASLPRQQSSLSSRLDREAAKITKSLEDSPGSQWGESLERLQGDLVARQAALRSRRQQKESAASEAKPTLMDQINAVHRELCLEPNHRDLVQCVDFLAGLAASHEAALDAGSLERRSAAAAHAKTPSEELAEHTAQLHADLARIAAERRLWEQNFQGEVQGIYTDFCATRGGVWCTTPAPVASANTHVARAALRENITREAKERGAALDAKLAKLAAERKEWERALLEHYGVAVPAGRDSEKAGSAARLVPVWLGRANLRWSTVASWASGGARLRGQEHAMVTTADLESAKWVGALPKVACVSVVPLGHGAKSQVKYVIEGFNKQTYEGPKQLVLVFHSEDEDAASVMRMYADGSYIKAVAARGPREDFPSATAFRFGAWSADADAIAQWDFDEQQDPQRLALQLRALAFASKPASLFAPSRGHVARRGRVDEGALASSVGGAAGGLGQRTTS